MESISKEARNIMDGGLNQFINTGLDMDLAKSIAGKTGLVQVLTTVNSRHGTYQRMQWVKPADAIKTIDKQYSHAKTEDGKPVKPVFFPLTDSGKSTTRVFTTEQVVKAYNRSGSRDNLSSFIKKNYYISDGENETRDFYHKKGGGYIPERQKLHQQIVDEIVSKAGEPKKGEKPVCILLGGGSASGKSTIRNAFVEPTLERDEIKVATVDSDEIKNQLPEYKPFQDQLMDGAAYRVHHESSDIANKAINTLISSGKNFIYDGTMKSMSKYDSLIDDLKEAGYEVRVVVADVPLNVAMKRSQKRANKTGRKVPKGVIEETHGGCALTYPKIVSKVDEFELYDNTGSEPILIQDNEGIHDQKLYDAFVAKGKRYQQTKEQERKDNHGR